jgi:hypothetical protein
VDANVQHHTSFNPHMLVCKCGYLGTPQSTLARHSWYADAQPHEQPLINRHCYTCSTGMCKVDLL